MGEGVEYVLCSVLKLPLYSTSNQMLKFLLFIVGAADGLSLCFREKKTVVLENKLLVL